MSTNVAILMGNLTKDPELRYTQSGTAVAKLGLAVNERYKKNDEWMERAHFFNITAWAKQAESAAQYLKKGSKVLIEGKLNHNTWEDKETGANRSSVDIKAEKIRFLDRFSKDDSQKDSAEKTTTDTPAEDDIPF